MPYIVHFRWHICDVLALILTIQFESRLTYKYPSLNFDPVQLPFELLEVIYILWLLEPASKCDNFFLRSFDAHCLKIVCAQLLTHCRYWYPIPDSQPVDRGPQGTVLFQGVREFTQLRSESYFSCQRLVSCYPLGTSWVWNQIWSFQKCEFIYDGYCVHTVFCHDVFSQITAWGRCREFFFKFKRGTSYSKTFGTTPLCYQRFLTLI